MPFTSPAIAASGAYALEMYKRQEAAERRKLERRALLMSATPKAEATSAKCPCCGSRQFVTHASRRICSYCRSEQDGQAPMSNYMNRLAADRCTNYFRMISSYGMSSGRKAR